MKQQFYRRKLPHWQIPEATYFVTYRLYGSIPKSVIQKIRAEYFQEMEQVRRTGVLELEPACGNFPEQRSGVCADTQTANPEQSSGVLGFAQSNFPEQSSGVLGFAQSNFPERSSGVLGFAQSNFPERSSGVLEPARGNFPEQSSGGHADLLSPDLRRQLAQLMRKKRYTAQKKQFKAYDDFLDSNLNAPHWLKQEAVAQLNAQAIHFYDAKRYQLLAFCIMSNHIHLLFKLLPGAPELKKVMQDLKKYTGLHSNRLLGREGNFWEEESYDHIVRDGELERIRTYILNNPVKAGLAPRWAEWPWTFCRD